jgi:hypothetical protein
MPGARRTHSLACEIESTRVSHYRYTGSEPGIPRAMVLRLIFVISPVIGLFCHRRLQDTSRKLDTSVEASGPHDFAVRIRAVRQRHVSVHRIPFPTSVTIASAPLAGRDGAGLKMLLGLGKAEYFSQTGWTVKNDRFARQAKSERWIASDCSREAVVLAKARTHSH